MWELVLNVRVWFFGMNLLKTSEFLTELCLCILKSHCETQTGFIQCPLSMPYSSLRLMLHVALVHISWSTCLVDGFVEDKLCLCTTMRSIRCFPAYEYDWCSWTRISFDLITIRESVSCGLKSFLWCAKSFDHCLFVSLWNNDNRSFHNVIRWTYFCCQKQHK